MRAARRRGLDLLERRGLGGRGHAEVGDALDPRGDAGAAGVLQDGLGDGAGGDAGGGLARGGTAAAGDGADAVLGVVGEVGVRGAVGDLHLRVGLRPLVGVTDDDGDGRTEREAVGGDAREHFRRVAFLPLGDEGALAWSAAGQLAPEEGRVEGHAGRATVDDHAEGGAMAFAEGGDPETVAVDVAHGRCLKKERRRASGGRAASGSGSARRLAAEVLGDDRDQLLALGQVAEGAVLDGHGGEGLLGDGVLGLGDVDLDFQVADGAGEDGHTQELVVGPAFVGLAHALHGIALLVDGTFDSVEDRFGLSFVAGGQGARDIRVKGAGVVWVIDANIGVAANEGERSGKEGVGDGVLHRGLFSANQKAHPRL